MTVTIDLKKQVHPDEVSYLQILNIFMRKCMEGLQLQLIDRKYCDPQVKNQMTSAKVRLHMFCFRLRKFYPTGSWKSGQLTSPPFASMNMML